MGKLAGGTSPEEICLEYELVREDILAALQYAAGILAEDQTRVVK